MTPVVICQDTTPSLDAPRWIEFCDYQKTLESADPADLLPLIAAAEKATQDGLFVAGYVAYDAASGADAALQGAIADGLPLIWLGIFGSIKDIDPPTAPTTPLLLDWNAELGAHEFCTTVESIKALIEAGDTYQVNYTFRLKANYDQSPFSLFRSMHHAQLGQYSAFIETDDFSICSGSPELFFSYVDGQLLCRPMKGTSERGMTLLEDNQLSTRLSESKKDRAENVMVVDMIRNDLGRLALPGSIEVSDAYKVEKFPTVHQMTTTVRASSTASIRDVFAAMFPCASITGAPKVHTMRLISQLETSPRRIYTGAVGFMLPNACCQFNVAIRTAVIDKRSHEISYGVGAGIVWDSDPMAEYEECLSKAQIVTRDRPEFSLLETLLYEPIDGLFLLDLHLGRLKDSAQYFGIPIDMAVVTDFVRQQTSGLEAAHRVRLLVDSQGVASIETTVVSTDSSAHWTLGIVESPFDVDTPFVHHKTTYRDHYQAVRDQYPTFDDVILVNESGFVTETTIANLVVKRDGRLLTPARRHGLLPGVFRQHLLETGEIEEADITPEDVRGAEALFLVNSVRKWIPASLSSF